jgi:hypothetical protein
MGDTMTNLGAAAESALFAGVSFAQVLAAAAFHAERAPLALTDADIALAPTMMPATECADLATVRPGR